MTFYLICALPQFWFNGSRLNILHLSALCCRFPDDPSHLNNPDQSFPSVCVLVRLRVCVCVCVGVRAFVLCLHCSHQGRS